MTPKPGQESNMNDIVGVAGQYLITQEYKGELSDKKNARVVVFISMITLISTFTTQKSQIKSQRKLTF